MYIYTYLYIPAWSLYVGPPYIYILLENTYLSSVPHQLVHDAPM